MCGRRCVLAAAVAVAGAALAPLPARAHALLKESSPAAGAEIAAGLVHFRLRFSGRIDAALARLVLVHPDQSRQKLVARRGSAANLLTAAAKLTPGAWALRWQVVASDGHVSRGVLRFTVRRR